MQITNASLDMDRSQFKSDFIVIKGIFEEVPKLLTRSFLKATRHHRTRVGSNDP